MRISKAERETILAHLRAIYGVAELVREGGTHTETTNGKEHVADVLQSLAKKVAEMLPEEKKRTPRPGK